MFFSGCPMAARFSSCSFIGDFFFNFSKTVVLFLPSSDLDRGVEIRFVVFLLVLREERKLPSWNGTEGGIKSPKLLVSQLLYCFRTPPFLWFFSCWEKHAKHAKNLIRSLALWNPYPVTRIKMNSRTREESRTEEPTCLFLSVKDANCKAKLDQKGWDGSSNI